MLAISSNVAKLHVIIYLGTEQPLRKICRWNATTPAHFLNNLPSPGWKVRTYFKSIPLKRINVISAFLTAYRATVTLEMAS
jgi:hypothetical protein